VITTKQITIRLPIERVEALQAAAKADHRSLAQQIEHQLAVSDACQGKSKDETP
jgi:hypothetical protein